MSIYLNIYYNTCSANSLSDYIPSVATMFKQALALVIPADSNQQAFNDALKLFVKRQTFFGAIEALQGLEDRPAEVIVIASELDDMTGVELAENIREIDAESQHFSYIIIIGPTLTPAISLSLEKNIDSFVGLSPTQATVTSLDLNPLAEQIKVGCRLAPALNKAVSQVRILQDRCDELEKGQLLDPLTGLGNRRMAEQSLGDCIRQIESRGGAVCFLMISVENYTDVINDYDKNMADQLIIAVSNKILNLVRPLDIVTYFEPGRFALVLIQPTIDQCTAECYQRIYDGVNLKSYKTPVGYLPANIGMSICASEAVTGPPNLQRMIRTAQKSLDEAFEADKILVNHLSTQI
ncbi:MAG: diguanylate cyclase (GGDEF)-like protein [Candidatus Azotimanducaceae bacterium]|jgi:diguanylate cyclase (GGDEF)-like protein